LEQEILKRADEKMKKAVEHVRHELATIRTGRASTALLDGVRVAYYGNPTPINQVAAISVPEPRLLVVQPYERTLVPEVVKAIQKADLGLNPSSDGTVVRLPIPPLNEERRKTLAKHAAKLVEDGKVAVRNVRRDTNDELKKQEKAGKVGEDENRRAQTEAQKLTDQAIKKLEEILEKKRQEIMEV
jgi:ribosome recycling factor